MSKILNSIINAQENQQSNRDTLVLKFIDLFHPSGERIKYVQKKNNKKQMERIILKYREVEYVYPNENPEKTKVTKGFEIVEEILVSKEDLPTFKFLTPTIVDKVTRVVKKTKND